MVALDTDTISRYHFIITRDAQGRVFVVDKESANGTFIDGTRLKVDDPYEISGGDEILIGHLRIIYHAADESPTAPMAALSDDTQRIAKQKTDFRIELQAPDQPVTPGTQIAAQVTITNTGAEGRRFRIEVSGVPDEWVRLERREIHAEPNDPIPVLINFKPQRRPDSKPGSYTVNVRVTPKDQPDSIIEADMPLHVLAYSGFGMALAAQRIKSSERFRLHIHNQGSGPLSLSVTGRNPAAQGGDLTFTITPPQVVLAPGQRLLIQGDVRPRGSSWFGESRRYPFDLVAHSHDASAFTAAVRGYVTVQPTFPGWGGLAILGALGMIGLALLIGLIVLLQPPPTPEIAQFSVSEPMVGQGTPVQLMWQVTNAASIDVSVNGTPVASGLTDSYTLDTSNFVDNLIIELVARNGGRLDTETQSVIVLPALTQDNITFTIQPETLVSNLLQEVTIEWNVPGADRTALRWNAEFITNAADGQSGVSRAGGQGSITLTGIPGEQLVFTLDASNALAQTLSYERIVTLTPARCALRGESAVVYQGASPLSQEIARVNEPQIDVLGIDSSRGWLFVGLPTGQSGWSETAQYECPFELGNLRAEVPPPTPTITPSPTRPSPTPTLLVNPTRTPTPTPRGGAPFVRPTTPTPTPTGG
jgi:hypothetical protein